MPVIPTAISLDRSPSLRGAEPEAIQEPETLCPLLDRHGRQGGLAMTGVHRKGQKSPGDRYKHGLWAPRSSGLRKQLAPRSLRDRQAVRGVFGAVAKRYHANWIGALSRDRVSRTHDMSGFRSAFPLCAAPLFVKGKGAKAFWPRGNRYREIGFLAYRCPRSAERRNSGLLYKTAARQRDGETWGIDGSSIVWRVIVGFSITIGGPLKYVAMHIV